MPEPTVPVQVRLSVGLFEAMEAQRGTLSRQKFVATAVAAACANQKAPPAPHVPQESRKVKVETEASPAEYQQAAQRLAAQQGRTFRPFSKVEQAGRKKK